MDEMPPLLRAHASAASGPSAVEFTQGLIGDIEDLRLEVTRLKIALETRAYVDQARGILMHRFGLDADAAFELMTRWALVTDLRIATLAEAMVKLAGGDPLLPPVTPAVARNVTRLLREQPAHGQAGARSVTR